MIKIIPGGQTGVDLKSYRLLRGQGKGISKAIDNWLILSAACCVGISNATSQSEYLRTRPMYLMPLIKSKIMAYIGWINYLFSVIFRLPRVIINYSIKFFEGRECSRIATIMSKQIIPVSARARKYVCH